MVIYIHKMSGKCFSIAMLYISRDKLQNGGRFLAECVGNCPNVLPWRSGVHRMMLWRLLGCPRSRSALGGGLWVEPLSSGRTGRTGSAAANLEEAVRRSWGENTTSMNTHKEKDTGGKVCGCRNWYKSCNEYVFFKEKSQNSQIPASLMWILSVFLNVLCVMFR